MNFLYFDHAATTPMRPAARNAMLPYLDTQYGNPSSIHQLGQQARMAVERAREQVASLIGASSKEIFFGSGGTEINNWVLQRLAHDGAAKGKRHLITSVVEHPSILVTMKHLEREGFRITRLPVKKDGTLLLSSLEEAICPDTAFASLMMVNNETGVHFPVQALGEICRRKNIFLHCDGVQALGHTTIDTGSLPVDFLTFSGHKIGAAKGVGCLYLRKGTPLSSFLYGGGQEKGFRAGTENVPGIVSFGAAAQELTHCFQEEHERLLLLSSQLEDFLLSLPGITRLGAPSARSPHILSFYVEGVPAESLLIHLDLKGIAISTGSACSAGSLSPSPVLLSMGFLAKEAAQCVRISLGHTTTPDHILRFCNEFSLSFNQLRQQRPLPL